MSKQGKAERTSLSLSLRLEIMQYSYWEHYKFEKEISMVLPIENPKRIMMRKATQEILEEIHNLQK